MPKVIIPNTTEASLWSFIKMEKNNRQLALLGIAAMIFQFSLFKWLYPFPDFIADSYSYIYAAQMHLNASVLPIGYSKFLSFFNPLTCYDLALVAFQYFFLQMTTLFFFFSLLFFCSPTRRDRNLLFVFLMFNPLSLYISNYVSNDTIFAALSLLWFTQLLWLIRRFVAYQIAVQAVLLSLCIAVGNNAYYYILISCFAFLLSKSKLRFKLLGISASFLAILPFAVFTLHETKRIAGEPQLSLGGGWILANNALFARRHITIDNNKLPMSVRELDWMANDYFRHAKTEKLDGYLSGYATNFFIENPQSPLKQYLRTHAIDGHPDGLVTWSKVSTVFEQYGNWLIMHNFLPFARYYLALNTKNYLLPPLESLELYNRGKDETVLTVQDWFNYSTPILSSVSSTVQGKILLPITFLFLIIQVFFVGGVCWWILRKGFRIKNVTFNRFLILTICYYIVHYCVAIVGSPIVMRYQAFPLVVTGSFALLLMEYMDRMELQANSLFPSPVSNLSILKEVI